MMPGADDLATLFGGGEPPQPYAQGVIREWNPDTFENVVHAHGEDLENLPVKSSVEALTYQQGDVVILARWPGSRQGASSWWIDGRAVIPGTGRGDEAIAFMTTALGSAVAKSVIGNSVFFAETSGNADVDYPSGGFVDPDSGTPGPELVDVEIGDSGRAIVTVGASLNTFKPSSGTQAAYMGVEVSGSTSIAANRDDAAHATQFGGSGTGSTARDTSRMFLLTGLNAGPHTFTAKFLTDVVVGTPSASARFNRRRIQVIAF